MEFGKILKFRNVRSKISGPMCKGALFCTFFIEACQTGLTADGIFIERILNKTIGTMRSLNNLFKVSN